MKIFVDAKPGAKKNSIEQVDATHFRVRVKAPPQDGRANQAVTEVLSEYFKVPKTRITILSGHRSRHKLFRID